jgi:hypothetical protein
MSEGKQVLRQGEWFFVSTNVDPKGNEIKPMELRAGANRPNRAELGFQNGNETYVSGTITHSGREHAPLKLKGWYTVFPNTAIESFTITGDID